MQFIMYNNIVVTVVVPSSKLPMDELYKKTFELTL